MVADSEGIGWHPTCNHFAPKLLGLHANTTWLPSWPSHEERHCGRLQATGRVSLSDFTVTLQLFSRQKGSATLVTLDVCVCVCVRVCRAATYLSRRTTRVKSCTRFSRLSNRMTGAGSNKATMAPTCRCMASMVPS